ncbi:FAD-dependent monooxygenase [Haloprofundus halophilus]|uniref:FAD-dependent monooxygenase n=1 Tax=Haloprofundus halophilus TaxID=2283527 RepID=UPI000E43DED8|nr:FAD-dependent monooxygenase [Haloprofundus halophilus]
MTANTTPESEGTQRLTPDVVVVGAGPAGCVLSYLLARSGVETLLLERNATLDREFRGFGFQPYVAWAFDQLGLLDDVLDLPHERVRKAHASVYGRRYRLLDFTDVSPREDYLLLMDQPPLLALLVERANEFETFSFRPATAVTDVRREDGRVVGVEARDRGAGVDLEVESRLVVGADGRYSTVREAAGIDAGLLESELEIVWFKLEDASIDVTTQLRVGESGILVYAPLSDSVAQCGWPIEKGRYSDLRERGIEAFRRDLVSVDPDLRGTVETQLGGFEDCSLLHVEPGLCDRWVDDGVLLLGDAAHVASPFGGQGNSLAVQDAVVAHEVIATALSDAKRSDGALPAERLGRFEERRYPAVERVLRLQRRTESFVTGLLLYGSRVPRRLRAPALRATFGALSLVGSSPLARRQRRLLAYGPDPPRVDTSLFVADESATVD